MRKCNTTASGYAFNKSLKDLVWAKRKPHPWVINWAVDKYGNLIHYPQYGKALYKYGWDIGHSKPLAKVGSDHINNLQPAQAYYNRDIKRDNYPRGVY